MQPAQRGKDLWKCKCAKVVQSENVNVQQNTEVAGQEWHGAACVCRCRSCVSVSGRSVGVWMSGGVLPRPLMVCGGGGGLAAPRRCLKVIGIRKWIRELCLGVLFRLIVTGVWGGRVAPAAGVMPQGRHRVRGAVCLP